MVRGSFPALMLAPVNFDALYAQELQRMQEAVNLLFEREDLAE